MGRKRFRIRQEFWLDVAKNEELELAELIDELKHQRVFSQAIRDGLRLIVDLWRGRVEVLLALFPWVEDYFYERFLEQQAQPDDVVSQHLERLERLLIQQGNIPVNTLEQLATASRGGPKPLAIPKVSAPIAEDDDIDLVVTKAKSDGMSAQNFLDSAFGLIE